MSIRIINFFIFAVFIFQFHFGSEAFAVPSSSKIDIINYDGYTFYEGEKIRGPMSIKVGGVLEVKGEQSFLDVAYKNVSFRLIGGKVSIEKAFKKGEKGDRQGIRLLTGKLLVANNRKIEKSHFSIVTPYAKVNINKDNSSEMVQVFVMITKTKTLVYVFKGQVKIVVGQTKKNHIFVSEGSLWESSPDKFNPPQIPAPDSSELKRILKFQVGMDQLLKAFAK